MTQNLGDLWRLDVQTAAAGGEEAPRRERVAAQRCDGVGRAGVLKLVEGFGMVSKADAVVRFSVIFVWGNFG